jgi:hypothetical protein
MQAETVTIKTNGFTYIFLVLCEIYLNTSEISKGLQFDFPKALVRLRKPDEIRRHRGDMTRMIPKLVEVLEVFQSGIGIVSDKFSLAA